MTMPLFDIPPVATDGDVSKFTDILRGRGWTTARTLNQWGYNDRQLRAVASASDGTVISGQQGYCLIHEATVEEAQHAARWLRHQGEAMIRRAYQIEQAMHRGQKSY